MRARGFGALVGALLLGCLLLFAFAGPLVYRADPNAASLASAYLPPLSPGHPLGTDISGRDLLARLMAGAAASLRLGAGAASLQLLLGGAAGTLAALGGRRADRLVSGCGDVLLSVPTIAALLLAGAVARDFPYFAAHPAMVTTLSIAAVSAPVSARIVRGELKRLRGLDFIAHGRAMGLTRRRLLLLLYLPSALPVLASTFCIALGDCVMAESVLSFLGVGLPADIPTLGNLAASAGRLIDLGRRSYLWLYAALLISALLLAVNLICERVSGDA